MSLIASVGLVLAATAPDDEGKEMTDCAIFQGDLLDRTLSAVRLKRERSFGTSSRIFALVLLCWVPLAILSALEGVALGPTMAESFLFDVAAYGEFLIGLPLLLIAEPLVERRIRVGVVHFADSGLVPESQSAELRSAIHGLHSAAISWPADLACVLAAYGFTWLWLGPELTNMVPTWHTAVASNHERLTLAGIWAGLVSVPVFTFMWMRWVYKAALWSWFLRRMANLKLRLIAGHPDRTGGIGFLSTVQTSFGLLIFAFGTVVATVFIYRGALAPAPMKTFASWGPVVGFIIIAPSAFLAPLFMFTRQLHDLKMTTLFELDAAIRKRVGHRVSSPVTAQVGSNEPESTCKVIISIDELTSVYKRVEGMRVVPFDLRSALELVGSAILPVLPLIPKIVPLPNLLRLLFEQVR